jgi:hypothetical protein
MVWTPADFHIEIINYDNRFWEEMQPRLQLFYETALLPVLVSQKFLHF